jgi:hypothetical protein
MSGGGALHHAAADERPWPAGDLAREGSSYDGARDRPEHRKDLVKRAFTIDRTGCGSPTSSATRRC